MQNVLALSDNWLYLVRMNETKDQRIAELEAVIAETLAALRSKALDATRNWSKATDAGDEVKAKEWIIQGGALKGAANLLELRLAGEWRVAK